ncbi:MAG: twin-arginine translocase subunit TatC [Pseudomonadota bacterium]
MNEAGQQSLLRFLIELRKRLVVSLLALLVIFCGLFYFANDLYTLLAEPLLDRLPKGHGLIATSITAPFMVPCELTMVFSLYLGVPFFLYQLWAFVAPALYTHERRLIWPLLLISTLLFYAGSIFAYFTVLPMLFNFLTQTAPRGVIVSPDIGLYLDFTLKMLLTFGVIFEVPVLTVVLIWSGITSREKLVKIRPYVIIAAFIIGMLLAPPDVLSQTLLAVPLWLLFEVGLLAAKFLVPSARVVPRFPR